VSRVMTFSKRLMACDFPTRNCDRRTRGCLACLLISMVSSPVSYTKSAALGSVAFKLDPKGNGVSCQFYDAELEILMVGLLQEKSNSVRS
jgi:hypothetical protein